MSKPKWLNVGSMRKGSEDKGGGFYLKIEQDIPAGSIIRMEKPADRIDRLVQLGHLTEDQAEERKNKIPDYVKFDLVLPPKKEDSSF